MHRELGEFLALCRDLKGLSLRQVEKGTGISNATLCQLEKGLYGLSFMNAVKLSDFYGVSLDRLAKQIRKVTK